MRPREVLCPPLPPLSRDDRSYIRGCAEAGDTDRQIAAWSGRPLEEVRAVLGRAPQPTP